MDATAVDLKNAYLATPLTTEGKLHMGQTFTNQDATINKFLSECYVEPDFITLNAMIAGITTEKLDADQDYDYFLSSSKDISKYQLRVRKRSSQFQKEEFEKALFGYDIDAVEQRLCGSVFLIEGPAGCGKTTYSRKLLSCSNFVLDYYDIETATQRSCKIFDNFFDFSEETFDPIKALEILLLKCIHLNLTKTRDEDEETYRARIEVLCSIYNDYFISELYPTIDSCKSCRLFFNFIHKYTKKEIKYNELSDALFEIITNIINKDTEKNDESPGIKFLLGIIMRIYFCNARISGKKSLLFLDNIERYIISTTGKPYLNIYDIQLQEIINSVYIVADEIEDLIYKIFEERETKYETSFGILIAIRESTINLAKKSSVFSTYFQKHHAENMPTYVNITNWFNYDHIIKKKTEFFLGKDLKNEISQAFSNIMDDSTMSRYSLRIMFVNMFNDNFRRFAANLTEAFIYYEDAIKMFNKIWADAKYIEIDSSDKNSADYLKHLCRKLMLRIVLDYMQNNRNRTDLSGFFDDLMSIYDPTLPIEQARIQAKRASYARIILTYLDNADKENENIVVSYPELIMSLLHKPIFRFDKMSRNSNVALNDPEIDIVADILEKASETSKIHTNGTKLLTLTLDAQNMNGSLAEEMKTQWNRYRQHNISKKENFSIKITPAGSVFSFIFPCFEYFACRYQPSSIPLLLANTEKERHNILFGYENQKEEVIRGIVDCAMECIDIVIKNETRHLNKGTKKEMLYAQPKWLYKVDSTSRGIVHPIRIIEEHLGYLRSYKKFLIKYAEKSLGVSYDADLYLHENDTKKGVIDVAIDKYTQKREEILRRYPDYITLGDFYKYE